MRAWRFGWHRLSDAVGHRLEVALATRLKQGGIPPDQLLEGARRAITVSLGPIIGLTAPVFAPLESVLDRLREADGLAFDYDGD